MKRDEKESVEAARKHCRRCVTVCVAIKNG